jgi:cell wall-associated NlpC family hydrolase
MSQNVEKAVADLAAHHADKRLHVFDLKVESDGKLSGRVLEKENLEELRAKLSGIRIDDSKVQVLRKNPPALRMVATNLTDLHKEPSFLSEMLLQVFNGTALEILEEQEKWCFVRQVDGYLGWVHRPFLAEGTTPRATHVVSEPVICVYPQPVVSGEPLTRVLAGTFVAVTQMRDSWAHLEFAGTLKSGWVRAEALRPIASLPLSEDDTRRQLVADARKFFGVYYLWGGNSAWGTDCSGLSQLIHRLSGYTLPRDCDMQFAKGKPVEPPFSPGDLLYFASSTNPNKVGHVGLSTGGWNMVHSSRTRNGVYEEDVQANENLRTSFAGARSFLDGT